MIEGKTGKYPWEYVEMKFCERFHISPKEFAEMPTKKIDLWLSMSNIEMEVEKLKNKLKSNLK